MSFGFGDFELDQERRQLLRSGEPVPLEPKAYELLSLLLERGRGRSPGPDPGRRLAADLGPESTLAVVVNGIRQALGDDARHPRFIRTVHGFGYAFCGEAREAGAGGASEAVVERPYPGLWRSRRRTRTFFGREAEVEAGRRSGGRSSWPSSALRGWARHPPPSGSDPGPAFGLGRGLRDPWGQPGVVARPRPHPRPRRRCRGDR